MKDIYRKNHYSGQPMAIRNLDSVEFGETLNHMWLDRLITSMYIVLSVSLTLISIVLTLGTAI